MSVEPKIQEQQYPDYFPLNFEIFNNKYQEFPELRLPPLEGVKLETECMDKLSPRHIRLRRSGNYAALERMAQAKTVRIGSVQRGEIVGDLEWLLKLDTYLVTIKVSHDTVHCLQLSSLTLNRILRRYMSPVSFTERLRSVINAKMHYRANLYRSHSLNLMVFMSLQLFTGPSLTPVANDPQEQQQQLQVVNNKQSLNLSEADEHRHLMHMFIDGRAALRPSYVRGGVYFRDLANTNARERRRQQQYNNLETSSLQTGHITVLQQFPLSQQKIYELQLASSDPIQFLESVQRCLRAVDCKRLRQRHTVMGQEPPDEPEIENPVSLPEIVMHEPEIHLLDGKEEFEVDSLLNAKFRSQIEKVITIQKKTKISTPVDIFTTKENIQSLQNYQLKFLNSLCSEKSQYQLKVPNKSIVDTAKNKRIHFLPTLKNQCITNKNIPKRGARVIVKRHPCLAERYNQNLINHSHNHFQIVDQLEESGIDGVKLDISKFMKVTSEENQF